MGQLVAFLIVGGIGFCVDLACFIVLDLYAPPLLARVLSFAVAVQVTYLLNARYSFRTKTSRKSYVVFLLGQAKGAVLNILVFTGLVSWLGDEFVPLLIAFCVGSTVALIFNFLYAKHLAFK